MTPEPRFVRVSRRAFLARGAAIGGLIAVPAIACAPSDEEVFASAASTTTTAPPATSAPPTTGSSTTTTAARRGPATTAPTTTAPPITAASSTFPSGGELLVAFTFAATSGGRVNNPYIAVWVEDPTGELVATISVWFEAGKGVRWLPDLRRWYAASDGDATTSGATRVAGSYTVSWDGTDLDGKAVPAGEYVVLIEAAREHGPYELVSGTVTIGDQPFTTDLTPSGELTAASVELHV